MRQLKGIAEVVLYVSVLVYVIQYAGKGTGALRMGKVAMHARPAISATVYIGMVAILQQRCPPKLLRKNIVVGL